MIDKSQVLQDRINEKINLTPRPDAWDMVNSIVAMQSSRFEEGEIEFKEAVGGLIAELRLLLDKT